MVEAKPKPKMVRQLPESPMPKDEIHTDPRPCKNPKHKQWTKENNWDNDPVQWCDKFGVCLVCADHLKALVNPITNEMSFIKSRAKKQEPVQAKLIPSYIKLNEERNALYNLWTKDMAKKPYKMRKKEDYDD